MLQLLAWLGAEPIDGLALRRAGRALYSTAPGVVAAEAIHALPPWFVTCLPGGTRGGGVTIDLAVPRSTYRLQLSPGFTLEERPRGRPVPRRARHQPCLRLALPEGAPGQRARLRHHRSQRPQPGDRRLRTTSYASATRLRARGHGADSRFRAQPHGHRQGGQRVVARRPRVGQGVALQRLLRHRLDARAAVAEAARCCFRSSGDHYGVRAERGRADAPASMPTSGTLSAWYYDHRLSAAPRLVHCRDPAWRSEAGRPAVPTAVESAFERIARDLGRADRADAGGARSAPAGGGAPGASLPRSVPARPSAARFMADATAAFGGTRRRRGELPGAARAARARRPTGWPTGGSPPTRSTTGASSTSTSSPASAWRSRTLFEAAHRLLGR